MPLLKKTTKFFFGLSPDYEKRVFGLDVFRAVAIILVVISHGKLFMGNFLAWIPSIPLPDGVELFFVLSGFLIGGILLRLCDKNPLTFKGLFKFWKRRWLRTLPNYYLVLLLNILFVYWGLTNGDLKQVGIKFFLFLQNFSSPFYDFFWESWSLSIEEWFYILFPLSLVTMAVFKLKPKQLFLIAAVGFLLFSTFFRIYKAQTYGDTNGFWLDVEFRKIVLTRLDAIMFGVLAAYAKYYFLHLFYRFKTILFILGIFLLVGITAMPIDPNQFFAKTFYFSFLGFGAALLLPLADSVKQGKGWFKRSITHISLVSYSMYLLHFGLIAMVIHKHFLPTTTLAAWLTYLVYWAVTIKLSTLLYKFFEKPVMDLKG